MSTASTVVAASPESPSGSTPRPRLLLVGPLPSPADVVGGTKVSFADLVRRLGEGRRFALEVLDTTRARAGRTPWRRAFGGLRRAAAVARRLARRAAPRELCLLCVSPQGGLFLGPLAWALCRLRGRPLAVRAFGGDLDLVLERAPRPLAWLARRTFLAAPLVLLQTRALCERFAGARWLPTCREVEAEAPEPHGAHGRAEATGATRFALIGQLRPEKGLREALAASDRLPEGALLHLWGPPMPGFDPAEVARHPRARWHGPLASERVIEVLRASDALVLPTFHAGEGIPGIVVEALQCGLPVIATDWRSLPEIVADGENGLLVPPGDAAALAEAMLRLHGDPALRRALAEGARASGARWRASAWIPRLEAWLEELAPPARRAA